MNHPQIKNLGKEQPQTESKKDDQTNDDLDYNNDDSSSDEQLAATFRCPILFLLLQMITLTVIFVGCSVFTKVIPSVQITT